MQSGKEVLNIYGGIGYTDAFGNSQRFTKYSLVTAERIAGHSWGELVPTAEGNEVDVPPPFDIEAAMNRAPVQPASPATAG